jgi:hypothetical protein
LKVKYDDISVEMGDEIGLIGMQVKMDRFNKRVILTQPKMLKKSLLPLEWIKVLLLLHWAM